MARIGYRQHHIVAGLDGRPGFGGVRINHHVLRFNHQFSASRHGVRRIHGQIQEHLLDLARVRLHPAEGLSGAKREFDILVNQPLQQLVHVRDQRVHVEDGRFQRLPPAERQHLTRERSGAVRRLANLLAAAEERVLGGQAFDNQLRVSLDHREQVIEVVSDTARQPAQRFHLLRTGEALLRAAASVLRFSEACRASDRTRA